LIGKRWFLSEDQGRVRRAGRQVGLVDSEERGIGKGKMESVEISGDVVVIIYTTSKISASFSEYVTCILRVRENIPYGPRNDDYKSYHVMEGENLFGIYVKY
jgi:hypothetical protein